MTDRANIFGELDVSGFEPQQKAPKVSTDSVRKVSEKAGFTSREPERKRIKHEPRRYRTGRNAQFTCKADPDVVDAIYRISDERKWVIGLTLERAVAALEKEIAADGAASSS